MVSVDCHTLEGQMQAESSSLVSSRPLEALGFILHRNRVDVLDEQYRQANEDIKANGDPANSRWS